MAVLNILNIVAASFYLYLFIVVQRMSLKGREHRLIGLSALALFQWTLSAYFVYNSQNIEVLNFLVPFSCIGMFFFFPLTFHFAYSVCFKRPMPLPLFVLIYLIALAFSIVHFVYPFSLELVLSENGAVVLRQAVDNPLNLVWLVYVLTTWLVPTWFYMWYYRHTPLNRERRQAKILIRMIIICIVAIIGEYYLTPLLPNWNIPTQSPLLFSMWIAAMVYAIWRYGFLRIGPEYLTDKILESIEDLVLLYDMQGRQIYRNRKAVQVLGEGRVGLGGDGELVEKVVRPLLSKSASWSEGQAERQLSLSGPSPRPEEGMALPWHGIGEARRDVQSVGGEESAARRRSSTVNYRVKPLMDRFGDPLGVLVTGTVAPDFEDFVRMNHLTVREAEVLEYLLAGWTSQKTARSLDISERTVKAHITKIYSKTGATNRVELANMLIMTRELNSSNN